MQDMQDMQKTALHGVSAVQSVETNADLQEDDQFEIDLVELLYRLLEKAKYIVAASILGALIVGVITYTVITPRYTATAKLYVMNASEAAINLSDFQMGTYLTSDYQEVFKNWHVHEMVLQELNLPYTYAQLSSMLEITNPSNTRVLYISVTSTVPLEAKAIADTYAKKAQEFIASTMDTKMPNIFEEALLPTAPSSPNKTMNIVIGFMVGLLLSCALIIGEFLVDDRIRSSDEIVKHLGLPMLGIMPRQSVKSGAARRSGRKEL